MNAPARDLRFGVLFELLRIGSVATLTCFYQIPHCNGMGIARAHRVSYVGELGWEISVSADQAAHVWEALTEAGAPRGLRPCGLHAMDSCRLEKAYRHFGHDITDEDHVLEAGLGFAVGTRRARSSVARRCCASASRACPAA